MNSFNSIDQFEVHKVSQIYLFSIIVDKDMADDVVTLEHVTVTVSLWPFVFGFPTT